MNARTGRYRYVELPVRFAGAKLPDIVTIDMRKEPPAEDKWLAPSW